MPPALEPYRLALAEICRKHRVRRLDAFGSVVRGDFVPGRSDVDLFVEFESYDDPAIADQWFGLQEELEQLLGWPVDLTSIRAATNPYFLRVANQHRVTLYAA